MAAPKFDLTTFCADQALALAYGTPDDAIAETQAQAIEDYADELVRTEEVVEFVQDFSNAAGEILAAIATQQLATGRAPSFDTVRAMQRLRHLVNLVESAA